MHAAYKYSVAFIPDDCTSAYTVTLPLHTFLPFHGYASMHAGADVNARDHRKRTPLHVAVEGGAENQRSIIMLLRSKEADTMATDMNGNTPMDLALKKKNEDIVFTLLAPANDKKDTLVKHTLETFMKSDSSDISDDKVREKILELSPLRYTIRLILCCFYCCIQ